MAGGRVYVPPHRRAALLAALVLVALLALAQRPGKNATQRSGRMLIEAQPVAGAVSASSQPVGDVPTALTAAGGAGPVASLPVTAQAQPPSAPRAPNVLPGDMPAAPADEGAQRSTSALSAASQTLLAEATAKVALPDDQVCEGDERESGVRSAWAARPHVENEVCRFGAGALRPRGRTPAPATLIMIGKRKACRPVEERGHGRVAGGGFF